MENKILLVDDDRDYLEILKILLGRSGFGRVDAEEDPERAAARIEAGEAFDVALIDLTMPGIDGMELLDRIKNISPDTECLMLTAVNEARIAVECIKKGAYDYLVKPVLPEDLIASIRRTLERKRLLDLLDIQRRPPSGIADREPFRPIVTASPKLLKVMREAELHAASDVPVLITGESGTGKELLARAIHAASPRSVFRFTAVNMASLNASLFDAEFFGHMKGAFTGAERDRSGYLEHTHRGTLFLDEIGNLPPELQGKLLRFLQSGEYMKLGTNRLQQSDVRLIAATNEDLDRMIAKGAFRKDLYYRIRGGWLRLPPLRERPEDIPILVNSFLDEYRHPSGPNRIDERALSLLLAYEFPGNVRELKAIIASAVNLARGRPISVNLLPEALRKRKGAPIRSGRADSGEPFPLAQVEREHILRIYALSGENKAKAARLLGVGLNTLRRKLASYGIS